MTNKLKSKSIDIIDSNKSLCIKKQSRRYSNAQEVLGLRILSDDKWIKDATRTRCRLCVKNFSMFLRKHHCRSCGDIICHNCSRFPKVYDDSGRHIVSIRSCISCVSLATVDDQPVELAKPSKPAQPHPRQKLTRKIPEDEEQRMEALLSYGILDSAVDSEFDSICDTARQAFSCKIAAISFLDSKREWFKSSIGIAHRELPRDLAFCSYFLGKKNDINKPFVVLDTLKDRRFRSNPLVNQKEENLRFYAAAPIVSASGYVIGSVLVMDDKRRRDIDQRLLRILESLASLTMQLLEDGKSNGNFRKTLDRVSRETISVLKELANEKLAFVEEEFEHEDENIDTDDCDEMSLVNSTDSGSKLNSSITLKSCVESVESSTVAIVDDKCSNELVDTHNQRIEGMYLSLITQVTDTQQQLASQQGLMQKQLVEHNERIGGIEDAMKRIEETLSQQKSNSDIGGTTCSTPV